MADEVRALEILDAPTMARIPCERASEALKATAWPLIEAGKVRPLVHATFPLSDAAAAHALLESSAHIGKFVLTV